MAQQPISPLRKHDLEVEASKKKIAYNRAVRLNKPTIEVAAAQAAEKAAKVQTLLPVRIANNFSRNKGQILAAGTAFYFFFSGVAAVTGMFSLFALFLKSNVKLQNTLINSIGDAAPGLLKTSGHPEGIIDPSTLLHGPSMSIAAIVSLLATIMTGLNMLNYLRLGVRGIFAMPPSAKNGALKKAVDLLSVILIALLLALSSVASVLSSRFLLHILEAMNMSGTIVHYLIRASSFLITVAVNTLLMVVIIRVIAIIKVPFKPLLLGSLLGGLGLAAIGLVGTSAVSGTVDKYPALTPIAVPLILLLWFRLMCTIIFYGASTTKILWQDIIDNAKHKKLKKPKKMARKIRSDKAKKPVPNGSAAIS
ncbi:MAG: YhjD/YihY/BrkB family envelope integrity protein [Micrococcaceae bacterium]